MLHPGHHVGGPAELGFEAFGRVGHDGGVEAHSGHDEEVVVAFLVLRLSGHDYADGSHIDGLVPAGERDPQCRLDVIHGEVEVACQEVPRASGQQTHGHVAPDQPGGHRSHRAIPTERAHQISPQTQRFAGLAGAGILPRGLEPDRLAPAVLRASAPDPVAHGLDIVELRRVDDDGSARAGVCRDVRIGRRMGWCPSVRSSRAGGGEGHDRQAHDKHSEEDEDLGWVHASTVPPTGAAEGKDSVGHQPASNLWKVIDIKVLREDPEAVRASQRARGEDETVVDAVLAADERRRSSLAEFESLRAEQNRVNKAIGPLMGRLKQAQKVGEDAAALAEQAQQARATGARLSEQVKELDARKGEAEAELSALIRRIGNVVIDGVPAGGEDDFTVLKTVGTPRDFATEGFAPKDHVEILEGLGALDLARGAKVAESRFYYLVGQGVRLEQAMLNLALDRAYDAGFTQLGVPTLVNHRAMEGAGFLDAHADEVYKLGTDDLYLTGTSEVALAGLHAEEIIDLSDGPKLYTACSTCYRREAGSYGKDTRGIIRVHQFQKVEMFVYCRPEDAIAQHAALLAHERAMLDLMEVPYRVIDVAAGDLGGPAARKFDCEGWVPTQDKYRELTSTSNCTTFQARRLGIREKAEGGTRVVATLNGTLATTRWLVAILENHQQADGSVVVPAALRPYLRTDRLIPGAR